MNNLYELSKSYFRDLGISTNKGTYRAEALDSLNLED